MTAQLLSHLQYWLPGTLLLIGLYGVLAAPNLVRKLMGLNVLQVAVILFFITLGAKNDAGPPIALDSTPLVAGYVNPLPHALMLTAIVVGVSVTGVALALVIRIHREFGTLEEPELLVKLRE
jgi:multicomponent Na+:H+ antiporter subunit C